MTKVITVGGKITQNSRSRLRRAILAAHPEATKIKHSYDWLTSSFIVNGEHHNLGWEQLSEAQ
jgi:hypothetical protein